MAKRSDNGAIKRPSGDGERQAQLGYVNQYEQAAYAIYAGLERGDLEWIGLADRGAGKADDVVLGFDSLVIGYQFKTHNHPKAFGVKTLLTGANGILLPMVNSWRALKASCKGNAVRVRYVTNDIPSVNDKLEGDNDHSAAFFDEWEAHPERTLSEWKNTKWAVFMQSIAQASELTENEFDQFMRCFEILYGQKADLASSYKLSSEGRRLAGEISRLLPQMIANNLGKDRWTRKELLKELDWPDTELRHLHRFPIEPYVQRNSITEQKLLETIRQTSRGYLALIGSPGSGKSTLLQTAIGAEVDFFVARYLAYVPGAGLGLGRGEADDFLDDLVSELKRGGLTGIRFRNVTLHEKRQDFEAIIANAGIRFNEKGIRTLIVVDGLDHVPREFNPTHSFLSELPLPEAIPDGLVILLGTQKLDLPGLAKGIQDQASLCSRCITVAPLSVQAVSKMADDLSLDTEIPRHKIYELCQGHPLATRYLIEALREADQNERRALLNGKLPFDGGVEGIYESAWREIREDHEAVDVLGLLARSEGTMPPNLLENVMPSHAIERVFKVAHHLLDVSVDGWSIFHNSFRQFVLAQPYIKYGQIDDSYSPSLYKKLAQIAQSAPNHSEQSWFELRYQLRGGDLSAALALATPSRFRAQFLNGRRSSDIAQDIRATYAALRMEKDPTAAFCLLLSGDEIERRASAIEATPRFLDALLIIGDIQTALALVNESGTGGYSVVNKLLAGKDAARARALFDRIEPMHQLGDSSEVADRFLGNEKELYEWAKSAIHFRSPQQICRDANRIGNAVGIERKSLDAESNGNDVSLHLREEAALALLKIQGEGQLNDIMQTFGLERADRSRLPFFAALMAIRESKKSRASELISTVLQNTNGIYSSSEYLRRRVAIEAAKCGLLHEAVELFNTLDTPSIADLDSAFGEDAPTNIVRSVVQNAQLASMVGKEICDAPHSRSLILRPLQLHAVAIGKLVSKVDMDPATVTAGEVALTARSAISYAARAEARVGGEIYKEIQIKKASLLLVKVLLKIAAKCGADEFKNVVEEIDRIIAEDNIQDRWHDDIQLILSVAIGRVSGKTEEASRRLKEIENSTVERTPEEQIDRMAELAIAYAKVGDADKAQDILNRVPHESLGYSLPAKKDPQYQFWRALLKEANRIDPGARLERISVLVRQITGMMQTEGDDAARRIAHVVLSEAAIGDPGSAIEAARLLADEGAIWWSSLVNSLMIGFLQRSPELWHVLAITWSTLCLPVYAEPYYREHKTGSFLERIVAAAPHEEVTKLVESLMAQINVHGIVRIRRQLFDSLKRGMASHGMHDESLEAAIRRLEEHAVPERQRGMPSFYDNLKTLDELDLALRDDRIPEFINYDASRAYRRLLDVEPFDAAYSFFNAHTMLQSDEDARFKLVDVAINEGRNAEARQLIKDYDPDADTLATWTRFLGGGLFNYYQALLRLDGPAAHDSAYFRFVSDLASGHESSSLLLSDVDLVWPVLTSSPDWKSMWSALAEQLATTREHKLGKVFASSDPKSEIDALVELYRLAIRLPIVEVRWHVRDGLLRLVEDEKGREILRLVITSMLGGNEDDPAEALNLLQLIDCPSVQAAIAEQVVELVNHPDLAVYESARVLCKRWGIDTNIKASPLPMFYQFRLPEPEVNSMPIADPESGAMVVEDVSAWTHSFDDVVDQLAHGGITAEHIRRRAGDLIQDWGGIRVFGRDAARKLKQEITDLHLGMSYILPHAVVAARSLRYVAAELLRGGAIDSSQVPYLLYELGYSALPLPFSRPKSRPEYLPRPDEPGSSIGEDRQAWMNRVNNDTVAVQADGYTVVAEIYKFTFVRGMKMFSAERIRAPNVIFDRNEDFEAWIRGLDFAVWAAGQMVLDNRPAATIVRRVQTSLLPDVPRYMLELCPHWMGRLNWTGVNCDRGRIVDESGDEMARIIWWRDGGLPFERHEDHCWGEGVVVAVTDLGIAQLESITGELEIHVAARRTVQNDEGGILSDVALV